MSGAEIQWRLVAAARAAADRARASVRPPRWDRSVLAHELSRESKYDEIRRAAARRRWDDAQRLLGAHFALAPQRFLIAPSLRTSLVATIAHEFPAARADAQVRADRIGGGEYDLLGHRRLRNDGPNWHYDPVLRREAPRSFWSTVRFLDPAHGDHKVIWELNRHQHWLTLGRAYWLTGDPRYKTIVRGQLDSWLASNPPLAGINWASMLELAFRSISWVWALQFFATADGEPESPWIVDLLVALARQLRHIEQNLSYYFSPNTHLLGEALALYVAGRALPELRDSARWAATGRAILVDEIARQITPDGGHAERSAHYHRYTLDFYLMALAVARITADRPAAIEAFEGAVSRLAFVCRLLADDRGRLPQLGDDDGGALVPICGRAADDARDSLAIASAVVNRPDLRIGPTPEEAFWFLAHPSLFARLDRSSGAALPDPIASAALPDTGYYVSRSPAGDHLIVDAGPHGYQNGGHAHADALAMTLSVRGTPLLIDTGTGCYTTDPVVRDRFRSSQLHNTVTIDGRSQSIPRGPFHWRHVAHARPSRWRSNSGFDYIEATHDGYAPIEHRRHMLAVHGDLVIVADLIRASGDAAPAATAQRGAENRHHAAAHWHLDPRWSVDLRERRAVLSAGSERVDIVVAGGTLERFTADRTTGLGWHAPVYGRILPTTTLRVTHDGPVPFWIVTAFGVNPDVPIEAVEYVPVWAEAGTLTSSVAVRIERRSSFDYFVVAHAAPSAGAPLPGGGSTWRVAEFETDAHMLFCRVRDGRHVTRVGMVDGSLVRAANRKLRIALPRLVPDLNVDLAGMHTNDPFVAGEARLSGPGFGAQIIVSGRELPVAIERRATPRASRTIVNVNE